MSAASIRAEVEDFLCLEADLLDNWKLKEWEALLADDATYQIPANDDPEGDFRSSLFIIADDRERIHQRIIRALDPNCHAEHPKSRLSRIIGNVRIASAEGDLVTATANFIVNRYRRYERTFEYVGHCRYVLKRDGASFKIKERRMTLKSHELGSLGSVSFIL